MEMMIDEVIERFKSNAEYERTHGSLQGCLEFRQIAEWLKELKQLEEINERLIKEYISKVGCCDECFASIYCTVNGLRESRVPQDYCVENIERYFSDKAESEGQGMTREEAISCFHKFMNSEPISIPTLEKAMQVAIKALEQEPRKGHWIDCDNSEDYSADGYDCSVCGVNAEYATSYCPNCGARMEREVEE